MNQVDVILNKGKDFSFETVEMTGTTDPGCFIAFSAMDYDFYKRGGNRERDANVFFTTYAVSILRCLDKNFKTTNHIHRMNIQLIFLRVNI